MIYSGLEIHEWKYRSSLSPNTVSKEKIVKFEINASFKILKAQMKSQRRLRSLSDVTSVGAGGSLQKFHTFIV